MIICKGKSVQKGIAIGKIHVHKKKNLKIPYKIIEKIEEEQSRFDAAIAAAISQIEVFYNNTLENVGKDQAMIFEVHKMMIQDEKFQNDIKEIIEKESVSAEYAVEKTRNEYKKMFTAMENEYMQERSQDIEDISDRILTILLGDVEEDIETKEPVIVLAKDLTPSETVRMDKSKVLGFVLTKGSINSHTAILARSMNLPSLVNTDINESDIYSGQAAIIDGFTGHLILNPDSYTQKEKEESFIKWKKELEELNLFKNLEDVTTDGRQIKIMANIGTVEDLEKVLESDASGIGLFRTEFIYMGRDTYPSEEEQYHTYSEIFSRMNDKKVIIRTIDIGADKKVDYFDLQEEENPAMGYRAIRICLDRPDIFKTQLRAIYRASIYGDVGIMFPMIISKEEVLAVKEIIDQVKDELKNENVLIGEVEIGIMIETPAAALITEDLAFEVDFFSIGTNDLTQYTLAIDRQNQKLESICDTHHPALLKLIKMTVENGHKGGAWVGICGELAGDLSLTETFVNMGVDELSVSPSKVLELRKKIRSI